MIGVVDMQHMGNLLSVVQALRRIGAQFEIVRHGKDIERSGGVILPGVGAFADGMASLRAAGLVAALQSHVRLYGKPLLGICLGMQLLVETGEEHGTHEGLGLIRGRAVRLDSSSPDCRIPNMGWCDVTVVRAPSRLFIEADGSKPYYFAHSYHVECTDWEDVVATIDYGDPVTAAIEHENIFGVQFHPEKSQDDGLDLLDRFCRIALAHTCQ